MTTYVEQDCTFTHEGRTFEAGGAVVTPEYAIGYVKSMFIEDEYNHWATGLITDWHGLFLGSILYAKVFRAPSMIRMYQVEATINGVKYTGRTQGNSMIWKGKRMAKQ